MSRVTTGFFVMSFAIHGVVGVYADEGGDLTRFVDPMIGSDAHGHVFVGANVPFGAVQVGPNNFFQGWDWCSGYHYSDHVVRGFSHLHISGTGIADMGDVLLMPYVGDVQVSPGTREDTKSGYASKYSHNQEVARAGYYQVKLLDYDIDVELTATERVGLHRYRYPKGGARRLVLELRYGNSEGPDATKTSIEKSNDHTLVGKRFSSGWAGDQRVFYALESSVLFAQCILYSQGKELSPADDTAAADLAVVTFADTVDEVILKVGISPVSEDNALANIKAEAPGWDFDTYAEKAKAGWNAELRKIEISSSDEALKRTFYSALYHTMMAPALFNDHNGDYRGADKQVYESADFQNYTILSLWDTYRAAHPLYTLVQPERVVDFVDTMLHIYDQQGKLPVWHLMANETDTMVGYHAVPVIVDAYFKGFHGFDTEKAYEAVRASAMRDERGLKAIKERGYIPSEQEIESVAKAMEYAIDDWCIAQMASSLGKEDDFEYFCKRSQAYHEYFDPETQFMRGKHSDGSWREPFDPFVSVHRKDDYCEGNAWQYLWLVPQDVEGLIALLGGEKKFVERLDSLFHAETRRNSGMSLDMTGMIGQYVHGNEPSHHIAYLYAYAGEQWKTAERVRGIVSTLYSDKPDGICGNEDCGQMSAWYLFSAMGFYPVNPAAGIYVIGSPAVDKATIALPGNKQFTIRASNNSSENVYIQSVSLNGEKYDKVYIRHSDIMAGGELNMVMGPRPNREYGASLGQRPRSQVYSTRVAKGP